jgi:hypothetical protein
LKQFTHAELITEWLGYPEAVIAQDMHDEG